MEGFLWDVEADSLYLQCKKIWYIRLTSLDETRSIKIMPFKDGVKAAREQFLEWLHSFGDGCYIVAHNQLSFDVWAIWKLLNIVPRVGKQGKDWLDGKHVQYIDTFVLSMYLNPDSPKHSLEYLASGSEDEKMDYRAALVKAGVMVGNEPKGHEFTFWHPLMATYCDDDVKALAGVYKRLWNKAKEMYGDTWLHPSFRQMQKDYWLYSAQAHTGAKFHQERAKALVAHIEEKMAELKAQVDPELPPRPLKTAEQAFYKMPAKPYTKSGELSATMVKWLEKHNAVLEDGIVKAYGLEVPLQAGEVLPVKLPMEIEDNTELKDWFLANGWKPHEDFYNFKRDPDTGKPMRDDKGKIITTTPKIQHQGQICPNLLKIEGDIPKKVVKFLSYRNRKGVVEGWLSNWRLAFDGRISAEISGYAPTSRVRHRTVVNCPKADIKVLLGAEMRDLWVVDEGNWFCGTDAAALENRTLSHYTTKYDDGAFARMNLEGDIHCYSEDTEILTTDGWKTFGEVTLETMVAQWSPSGDVEFVRPSHVVWQDYEGEMVSFKGRSVDVFVTPNHRTPIIDVKGNLGGFYVKEAKDVPVTNANLRFPCSGVTVSKGIPLSDDEIRFLVATQADSYLAKDCSQIRFCFVKQRKVDRLREILDRLGVNYTYSTHFRKGRTEQKFYVSSGQFTDKMRSWLGKDKSFSTEFLNMSFDQCRLFIEEVGLWDGTVTKDGNVLLDTTCIKTRDIVMGVALVAGMSASANSYFKKGVYNPDGVLVHRVYVSSKLSKKELSVFGLKKSTVDYKGKIGCVSVPSSFVVVRRNGRALISGNTFNAFAFFPHLHKEFDINNPENKENPQFKPWRAKAKTGAYLLAFGGGAAKLASSLGLSAKEGKAAYANYWEKNAGLGKLKEAVEAYFKSKGKGKHIPAIDGRLVSVRGANVLISCLGQGLGAIAMSYAACLMDNWLGELYIDDLGRPYYLYQGFVVKRIMQQHDEYSWEVEDGAEEAISEMTESAIVKAGEILKLSIPLAAEGKMAYNGSWKDVH